MNKERSKVIIIVLNILLGMLWIMPIYWAVVTSVKDTERAVWRDQPDPARGDAGELCFAVSI